MKRRGVVTVDRTNLNGFVERSFDPIRDLPHGTRSSWQEYAAQVYFDDLEEHLCRLIRGADQVVGCVAWLTSLPVLKALSEKSGVSIVVQKEEFLRPDLAPSDNWRRLLREHYDALPRGVSPVSFDFRFTCTDPAAMFYDEDGVEPIRCCGISDKSASIVPRMHHKFLVFLRRLGSDHPLEVEFGREIRYPIAVWTGSMNPSSNGTRSLENAVVIVPKWADDMEMGFLSDRGFGEAMSGDIGNSYLEEWARVLGISEPLDWTSHDVTPGRDE